VDSQVVPTAPVHGQAFPLGCYHSWPTLNGGLVKITDH